MDHKAASISAALLLAVAPILCSAEANDLLTVTASINQSRDDNLFRRPADGSLGPAIGDRISTTQVSISLQKPVSLQRFELTLGAADNRYDSNSALNSTSNNHSAAWRWQLTPQLTGSLTSDRQQAQTDFADYRGAGQNLRTTEGRRFDANWGFASGWTLGASAGETKSTNSQAFVQDDSSRQRVASTLLRYSFSSGTSIALNSSTSDGEYQRAADPVALRDSGFSEGRDWIDIKWPLTGKTAFSATAGRVERKNRTYSARDYSGNFGNITFDWKATAKTAIQVAHGRSTELWEDASSSFATRESTSIKGSWQIAGKLALRATLESEDRVYKGFAVAPTPTSRRDSTNKGSLAIDWAAYRNLALSASVQGQRRSSNLAGLGYRATVAAVNARLTF